MKHDSDFMQCLEKNIQCSNWVVYENVIKGVCVIHGDNVDLFPGGNCIQCWEKMGL